MSPKLARSLLAAVVGLAALECIAAAFAYRSRLDADDWDAARAALDPELAVVVAPAWLEPLARMEIEAVSRPEHVARPDLRGRSRFSVLGLGTSAWSPQLEADLEDLPRPQLEQTVALGALTLSTYKLDAGEPIDDLLGQRALEVSTAAGRCRGQRPRWQCREGAVGPNRVEIETVEVDYRPRRCLVLELDDGEQVRVRAPALALGNVLRGHVGVADFNARLRSDALLDVELRVDGTTRARWSFSDDQGWAPFAVATEPGIGELELRLTPSVRGTWERDGYRAGRPHRFCVELRSLQETAP